jgi:hypothetical protein
MTRQILSAVLKTEPNMALPDEFYEALIEMHRGLTEEQSRAANAKLILLLANHVGDMAVLKEAIAIARTHTLDAQ